MRIGKIDRLCAAINARRELVYPSVGYLYYADIRGDGVRRRRTVWQIITPSGGVCRAAENRRAHVDTIAALENTLETI